MHIEKPETSKDKETILSIIKYILVTAIVLTVLYFGARVVLILLPVVIGFVLAHISNSMSSFIYRLFQRKKPDKKLLLSDKKGFKALRLISFLLLLISLIIFIILIVIALIAQVRNLISFLNNNEISFEFLGLLVDRIRDFSASLGGFLPTSTVESLTEEILKIQDYIIESIPRIATFLLNSLLGLVGNIPLAIFRIVVVILSGYYFITDRKSISDFIHSNLPSKAFVSKITTAITKVFSSLFRVMGGYVLILTITFLEALLALLIIRMPYAVVFALVVTIIDILPAVGASTCFVPIAIYMFSQGRIWEGIVALAFVGIIVAVRAFIEPKIIGSAMKLHPLATLVAMILGVSFFGLIGFIAGPALLVLIIGVVDSFGFEQSIRNRTGKLLNKIAGSERIIHDLQNDDPILKHIEMWKFSEDVNSPDMTSNLFLLKEKISELKENIPQIIRIETGIDTDSNLLIIKTDFSSYDSLNEYKNNSAYQEFKNFIENFATEIRSLDYRTDF